jgi:hypothetical protein
LVDGNPVWGFWTVGRIVVFRDCVRNEIHKFHQRNPNRFAVLFGAFDVVVQYAVPFAVNQQVFVRDLEAVVGDHIGVCALGVSFPRDGPLTVGVLATI